MTISITSSFESGNIRVLRADDQDDIRLEIESDGKADFFQWFYFRVHASPGRRTMTVENASKSSYVDGWKNYHACASYDLEDWFRVPTRYDNGKLIIEHEADQPVCYYAYFAPYTADRAMRYTARIASRPGAEWVPLGLSVDGRPIDMIRFGAEAELKKKIWMIARQHPGESMGSFFAEGFCDALLDPENSMAQSLLKEATIYVVPIMNPDGVARGHLRTNAAGTDLNRAWESPTEEASPEVLCVRNKMDEIGCDLFLDAHGDEAIANNFIAGSEGIPSWSPRLAELLSTFKNQLIQTTADFQDKEGYPIDPAGKANMRIACNAIAERFECLSMTLEMPFKDASTNAMPGEGWSPPRCRALAVSVIEVMSRIAPRLR